MSGVLLALIMCIAMAYVVVTITKWINDTRWNKTAQVIVSGLAVNVLILAVSIGCIPFVEPVCIALLSQGKVIP